MQWRVWCVRGAGLHTGILAVQTAEELASRPAQHGESASDPTKLLKGCSEWLADKAS